MCMINFEFLNVRADIRSRLFWGFKIILKNNLKLFYNLMASKFKIVQEKFNVSEEF